MLDKSTLQWVELALRNIITEDTHQIFINGYQAALEKVNEELAQLPEATLDPGTMGVSLGLPRSPHWAIVSREFRAKHPNCERCGSSDQINIHHNYPFHIVVMSGRADLELDERNLHSLCTKTNMECHLLCGHLDDYRSYNPELETDVEKFKGLDADQTKAATSWLVEKANRPKPWNEWTDAEKQAFKQALEKQFPPDPNVIERFHIT